MNEVQENVDRLAVIISNYVGVNDIGVYRLTALDRLFDQLNPSEHLRSFWRERFDRAKAKTVKEEN